MWACELACLMIQRCHMHMLEHHLTQWQMQRLQEHSSAKCSLRMGSPFTVLEG